MGGKHNELKPDETGKKTSDSEKQRKIDSVEINFDGDTELPGLNIETLEEFGFVDKPVLLKKNILEKNMARHPDVEPSEYREIVGNALYRPDAILKGHDSKPYFNFLSRIGADKSAISLLQVEKTNTGYLEIINMHWIDNNGRSFKLKFPTYILRHKPLNLAILQRLKRSKLVRFFEARNFVSLC